MSLVTLSTSTWTPIGPAPIQTAGGLDQISGRIQVAAPDPTNASIIYLGSDNGGIWKNINAPSWTPLTDQMPSPALGANFGQSFGAYHTLVVHPANHALVLGLVSGRGAGILQSTDAGGTWSLLANAQFDGQGLNSLAVHPTKVDTMYLAAGWSGAWTSTDGGTTWQNLANLPSGCVSDLIIARFNSSTLYAGVVGNTGSAQAQNGVYQSTDGGATWTQLGGLPSGAALGQPGATGAVRIESATKTGALYVSMLTVAETSSSPPTYGVTAVQRFVTVDSGSSWTPLTASSGSLENRSWHLLLAVDPGDEKHVLVNDSYSLYESWDSGASWARTDTTIGYLKGINHFDFVNLTFDANRNALVTADQGVLQYNPFTKVWTSLMGNLQVSEFYTITLDPTTLSTAYAVGQDIFCEKYTGSLAWNVMEEGINETGKILVNPSNPNQIFAFNPLVINQFVIASVDGGTTWNTILPASVLSSAFTTLYAKQAGPSGQDYTFAYQAQKAFAMDPSNPARLLAVADRIYETTDASSASPTWSEISGVLSTDSNNPFVIALAIAPSSVNTVYAATPDGRLQLTTNDGGSWVYWDTGLSGNVLDIRVDPNDSSHAFGLTSGAVWQLTPAGLPWINITGNLPSSLSYYSVFVAWQSPVPALFVGTDRGVYRSFDLGGNWTKWSPGLPNTRVNDLQGEMIAGDLVLAAATVGRGAWEILIQPWGAVATAIANSGNFGNVCVGSFADELLTINNNGWGPLLISNITSSDSQFEPPSVLSYPLLVNAGESIDLIIRFQPTSIGLKSATLTVFSNDPGGSHKIPVSGDAPAPGLSLLMANSGDFGKACIGSLVDEPLVLNNSGKCMLSITGITSSSAEFVAPQAVSYPLSIAPGNFLSAPIRFAPTSSGSKSATVAVLSNDPAGPRTIAVSGEVPSGKLAVTGSTIFGGVTACCCADRTISVCNVGECSLNVTSLAFRRKSRYWKLIHNPFPAVLHAGSCLSVVIQYRATERCSRSCELVIESDDPATPVKILDVLAYTVWNEGCCREHCEECQKGCCEKRHKESCCQQGYPCCDDDEEDDKS